MAVKCKSWEIEKFESLVTKYPLVVPSLKVVSQKPKIVVMEASEYYPSYNSILN
jgi:hypothetical protein